MTLIRNIAIGYLAIGALAAARLRLDRSVEPLGERIAVAAITVTAWPAVLIGLALGEMADRHDEQMSWRDHGNDYL